MQVRTKITCKDIALMQISMLFKTKSNLYTFFFIWTGIVFLTYSKFEEVGIFQFLRNTFIVAIGAFVLLFVVGMLISILFEKEKHGVIGDHTFTITDEGFCEETKGSVTTSKWIGIDKVIRSSKCILVIISLARIHIIPRRAFSSEIDYFAFGDLIETRIQSAKKN
jgi:hypothetical protein